MLNESVIPSQHTATPREVLSYLFLVTVAVAVLAFGAMVGQMVSPRAELIDLGAIDELSKEIPNPRLVQSREGAHLYIWLVYTENGWLALDGHAKASKGQFTSNCLFQWIPIHERFEDPCSGAKYSRTGAYLDIYSYLRDATVQDLDQYPITSEQGHLWINASRVLPGRLFVGRAERAECCSD